MFQDRETSSNNMNGLSFNNNLARNSQKLHTKFSKMNKFAWTSLLFVITIVLWIWQSSQPLLDGILPSISIGRKNLVIPVSELVAQCIGVATMMFAYSLYSTCADHALSLLENLLFNVLAMVTVGGQSIHIACVIIQRQLDPTSAIYPLVDFLHEHWSHNMFLFGFFNILLLTIWAEKTSVLSQQQRGLLKNNFAGNEDNKDSSSSSEESHNEEKSSLKHLKQKRATSFAVLLVGVRWAWPVLIGVYFPVFAAMTSTKVITFLFFCTTLVFFLLIRLQFFSESFSTFCKKCELELIILGSLTKASVVGILTLLVL